MPIYEYRCQACGRSFELLQGVDSAPPELCSCGARGTLKKLLSAPMIQFKGTGWYVTDYAKKNSGKDSKETFENKKTAEKASASSDSSNPDS